MFIHLPSTLKIANDLPIFTSYYEFVIVSPSWLAYFLSHDYLSYNFTGFFIYFLFLSDEGPMLETLDYTIRIGSTPTFLYFDKLSWVELSWVNNRMCSEPIKVQKNETTTYDCRPIKADTTTYDWQPIIAEIDAILFQERSKTFMKKTVENLLYF